MTAKPLYTQTQVRLAYAQADHAYETNLRAAVDGLTERAEADRLEAARADAVKHADAIRDAYLQPYIEAERFACRAFEDAKAAAIAKVRAEYEAALNDCKRMGQRPW